MSEEIVGVFLFIFGFFMFFIYKIIIMMRYGRNPGYVESLVMSITISTIIMKSLGVL